MSVYKLTEILILTLACTVSLVMVREKLKFFTFLFTEESVDKSL